MMHSFHTCACAWLWRCCLAFYEARHAAHDDVFDHVLRAAQEHLFLVCELLRANLYEFQKYNRESGDAPYFTLPRVQSIARQVSTASPGNPPFCRLIRTQASHPRHGSTARSIMQAASWQWF